MLEIQVREDGTVFIPAAEIANLGIKPGETLAVELRPHLTPRKSSRGLLKGVLPSLNLEEFQAGRAERLIDFEDRRGL